MRLTEAEYQEFLARQQRQPPRGKAAPEHRDMSEAKLLAHVREQAEKNGWLVYHTYDSRRSEPGFPDIVAVRPNVVLFSELKRQTEKLKPDQVVWRELLTRATRVEYREWRPSDVDEITRYFWHEI